LRNYVSYPLGAGIPRDSNATFQGSNTSKPRLRAASLISGNSSLPVLALFLAEAGWLVETSVTSSTAPVVGWLEEAIVIDYDEYQLSTKPKMLSLKYLYCQ
jgi:hypothetical protein